MKFILLSLLTFFSTTLFSEAKEEDTVQQKSLINFEGLPSAVVGGCVNAVSGDYFEVEADLVIPGIEPLVIQRNCSSSHCGMGNLTWGWNMNHAGVVCESQYAYGRNGIKDSDKTTLLVSSGTGTIVSYESPTDKNLKIDPSMWKKGLTNGSANFPSGKTNLGNNLCNFDNGWTLKTGSGDSYEYKLKKNRAFLLSAYNKSNRFRYIYSYDNSNKVSEITLVSPQKEHLASVSLHREKNGINIYSPTGKKVRFNVTFFDCMQNQKEAFITSVESDFGPTVNYNYEKFKTIDDLKVNHIIKKSVSPERFTEISYYKYKDKKNSGTLTSKPDYRFGRVKEIIRPLGLSGEPCKAYSFYYSVDNLSQNGISAGYTQVNDALGRKSIYRYNDSHLECIDEYLGNRPREYKLYRKKITNFGKTGSFYQNGHLVGFGVVDEFQFCKKFTQYLYDNVGNVTKVCLYGNLTGGNFLPVEFDLYGIPTRSGVEVYETNYQYSADGFNNIIEESDSRKRIVYSYYPESSNYKSQLVYVGNKIVQRSFFEYDESGFLIKETKDNGSSQEVDNLQDASERHITITHPNQVYPRGLPKEIEYLSFDFSKNENKLLRKTVNTYSLEGQLIKEELFDGDGSYILSRSWEYDSQGNLIKEIDALGHTINYVYDKFKNLISKSGPLPKNTTTYTYDFCNRLVKEEISNGEGLSVSRNFYYDKASQKIGETDHFGNRTDYTYDDLGRLVKTELPAIVGKDGILFRPTTITEYDTLNGVCRTIDAIGGETITKNTVRQSPYHRINADGTEERNEYALDGTLVKSIDRLGNLIILESDYLGRPLKKAFYDSSGNKIKESSSKYNAFHLISETDCLGIETVYEYDFAGRLSLKKRGQFKEIYEYDNLGRLYKTVTFADQSKATCSYKEYDFLDRITEERIETLEGEILYKKNYEYDALGRKIKDISWGEKGAEIIQTSYNLFGEIVEVITAEGDKTLTSYNYTYQNEHGQRVLLVEIIDALGNIHRIEKNALGKDATFEKYNALNEKLSKKEYVYDGLGNIVKTIETSYLGKETKSNTTEKTYDLSGKLISVVESSQSDQRKETQVHFNAKGLKEAVTKPSGVSLVYTYDELGRAKELKSTDGSIHYIFQHDLLDNIISVEDPIMKTFTFREYNTDNQLVKETIGNGLSLSYTYDSLGNILSIALPDGSSVGYTYEAKNLKEIVRYSPEMNETYHYSLNGYDLSGRLLSAYYPNLESSFAYDKIGRVSEISTPVWSENLIYDKAGNVIERNLIDNAGSHLSHFSYDGLYQLSSEKGTFTNEYSYDGFNNRLQKNEEFYEVNELNQIISKDEQTYSYDDDGNLKHQYTNEGSKSYSYDALGRLTRFKTDKIEVSYLYDSFNRRLSKTVIDEYGNETFEKYLYASNNEIGSFDKNNLAISFRVLGQGLAAEIRATIAIEMQGHAYAVINDHNGCITCLVDMTTGEVCCQIDYSGFGEQKFTSSKLKNLPWGYSSKRLDPETGLIFFGRRYYNPEDGRWITKDPLGDADGPNLYAYVKNQPLTHFDAYGFFGMGGINNYGLHYHLNNASPKSPDQAPSQTPKLTYRNFEKELYDSCKGNQAKIAEMNGVWSRSYSVNGKKLDKKAITYINGINNTYNYAVKTAEYISALSGGHQVDAIYNCSHGNDNDLYESFINLKYECTEPSIRLRELWDQKFEEIGLEGYILHYCHSQGAIITRNALMEYPEDLRKRIILVAIAPGSYIDENFCSDITHYLVTKDVVPMIDATGYLMAECQKTIRILESIEGGQDHAFRSATYQEAIQKQFQEFIKG